MWTTLVGMAGRSTRSMVRGIVFLHREADAFIYVVPAAFAARPRTAEPRDGCPEVATEGLLGAVVVGLVLAPALPGGPERIRWSDDALVHVTSMPPSARL